MILFEKRVADFQLRVSMNEFLFEFGIDLFMDDKPSCGSATLTSRSYCAKSSCGKGDVQVGILRNDDGIVTEPELAAAIAVLEKAKKEKQQKIQKETFKKFDFYKFNYDK